jgi:N-methylhydantoinase A
MASFVAVDTGGTFTDLVALDVSTGELTSTKSLTTYPDAIGGILDCLDKSDTSLDEAEIFKHGTTLVINTLIQRTGPAVALVTTKGFRDVLALGRGSRSEPFNLFFDRDPVLVPRRHRFELAERMDAQGCPEIAPARDDVVALAKLLKQAGFEAVAVSFINAYCNPLHEQQVTAWLRELLPDCYICCGTELSREWYEYERTASAAANAYVGPGTGRYVATLAEALGRRRFHGALQLMSSSGGALSARQAASSPLVLIESGPVGGCIAAAAFGEALGFDHVIAFDMGGTTAKCALVERGTFGVESTYYVGGYGRGLPVRVPVIDIVEVGAGGGSIAWLDEQGGLHVGPQSAGSTPGPVCYGRGGTAPTVTDANLMLSRINAENFQGGEMQLDVEATRRRMEVLATRVGYGGEDGLARLSAGILAIAAVTMAGAIKRITVERGKDPRHFAMFAYGGGGPLHGAELARSLGIRKVIIPPEPANFSALGMLLADLRREADRTFIHAFDDLLLADMNHVFAEMERALAAEFEAEFDAAATLTFDRFVELRFVGQFHAVRVELYGISDLDALRTRFMHNYVARFGHANPRAGVEAVGLRVGATLPMPKPKLEQITAAVISGGKSVTRPVYYSELKRSVPTRVLARRHLAPGDSGDGPVVIEEYGSTTVIGPHDRFEVGRYGEITLHIGFPE